MIKLPLFPLNTVLFPGMPLPLHIFESRYKQMIGKCRDGDKLFGVNMIKHGNEALVPLAEPYSTGCTARIIKSQFLEQGRMQITAVGEQRFRIFKLMGDLPYLVGEVEYTPLKIDKPEELQPGVDQLTSKLIEYIKLLNQIEKVDLDPDNLPQDPLTLGFMASSLLQMPPNEKQNLLECENTIELINSTSRIYSREIAFLRVIIERGKDQSKSPVSQN